jgi:predicted nuclease of predicted toxin-antitoxin system
VKFKTDENLPVEAAEVLRDAGYDALTVWDENLDGSDDETIASHVRLEDRVLITLDLDFANIRAYPPDQHQGIIALRLRKQDRRVTAALKLQSPVGELWIVEQSRIRFRNGS